VFLDRVNGELAMSRALGDYQYKRNEDLSPAEQMVSCYPDVAVHKRADTDQIMVLACDGVWDVMSNCEAITYLQDIILKEDANASSESMADALVQISLAAGSTDNISAVVVKLNRGME
jgi:protein phosphatase PTC2/3